MKQSPKSTTTMNQKKTSSSIATNGPNRRIAPRPPHNIYSFLSLGPHNTNAASVRHSHPSMIPIRVRVPAGAAPTTPANLMAYRITNAHPQPRQQRQRSPRQPPTNLGHAFSSRTATHQALAASLSEKQTVLQSVESAFTVYGERLQADLRDFRALCTTLVVKELEEKRQLHTVCLKMMRERDMARQRIHELETSSSSLSSGSKTGDAAGVAAAASASATSPPPDSPRGSKRARDEVDTLLLNNTSPRLPHASPSTSPEPHARRLAGSITKSPVFPVHSPTASPYRPVSPLLIPPPSSSAESEATMPPLSALSSGFSDGNVSPIHDTAISAFPLSASTSEASGRSERAATSEGWIPSLSNSASSSSSSLPSLSPPMEVYKAIMDDAPPMKRRKSCEAVFVQSDPELPMILASTQEEDVKPVLSPQQTQPSLKPAKPVNTHLASELLHVDIMYAPMNGQLVCRACLLKATKQTTPPETTKVAAATLPANCKSFPINASWDDLRDHCVRQHPDECMDVARLHPAEVFRLRRQWLTNM